MATMHENRHKATAKLPCAFVFVLSRSLSLPPSPSLSSWSPTMHQKRQQQQIKSPSVCFYLSLSCSGGGPQAGEPGQGGGRAARPDGHPAPKTGRAEGSHGQAAGPAGQPDHQAEGEKGTYTVLTVFLSLSIQMYWSVLALKQGWSLVRGTFTGKCIGRGLKKSGS